MAALGIADSGSRKLRQAGDAPTSANWNDPPGCPLAAPSSVAHCTWTSRGSKRPAADTTSSGPALSRAGSRYQPDRSLAGTWMPERQLPSTGVRAGSRL